MLTETTQRLRLLSRSAGLLLLLCLQCGCTAPGMNRTPFRFLAMGDIPYSPDAFTSYEAFLDRAGTDDFDFFLHVGDIKGGGEPCSDEQFRLMQELFRRQRLPMVYTPGDNEWTDCHGELAGAHDPVERLGRLRELFFDDPGALRLAELDPIHQSENPTRARFVENYRFLRGGVLFVALHVVGSNNGNQPERSHMVAEYEERNQAVLEFLDESVGDALRQDVAGLVLIIHANPDFETSSRSGQRDFVAAVRTTLSRFERPVVCIHGDSHYYRVDKPLRNEQGWNIPHFTRLEVFGHPNVAGVAVTVDARTPQVFSYQPYY